MASARKYIDIPTQSNAYTFIIHSTAVSATYNDILNKLYKFNLFKTKDDLCVQRGYFRSSCRKDALAILRSDQAVWRGVLSVLRVALS